MTAFGLAWSSMKGDENRIPYIDNIFILINLIEYDVILGVLVDHAMIRNVLKYLAYCIYFIEPPSHLSNFAKDFTTSNNVTGT